MIEKAEIVSPRGRPSASCTAEQTQRSSSFPCPIRLPLHLLHVLRPQWVKWSGDLDFLTLKVVCESHVMWTISVPILVFLGLSVLDLGPMYATDRETSDKSIRIDGIVIHL